MVYNYLLMAKTLMESLSYDEFCAFLELYRSSDMMDNMLQQFKLFDIDSKKVWAFIDSHIGCDGSLSEKTKFRRFAESIGRMTLNTHRRVLNYLDGVRNKAEL